MTFTPKSLRTGIFEVIPLISPGTAMWLSEEELYYVYVIHSPHPSPFPSQNDAWRIEESTVSTWFTKLPTRRQAASYRVDLQVNSDQKARHQIEVTLAKLR